MTRIAATFEPDVIEAGLRLEGEGPGAILRWAASRYGASSRVRHRLRCRGLRDHRPRRAREASENRHLHARHRRAVPRDVRAVASPRGALRHHDPRRFPSRRSSSKRSHTARSCGSASRIGVARSARCSRSSASSRASMAGSPRSGAEQTADRANAAVVESDRKFGLIKVNPARVTWTHDDVWAHLYARTTCPTNVLHERGYPSIGCQPCTWPRCNPARTRTPVAGAAGRKTECGLLVPPCRPSCLLPLSLSIEKERDTPCCRTRSLIPVPAPRRRLVESGGRAEKAKALRRPRRLASRPGV